MVWKVQGVCTLLATDRRDGFDSYYIFKSSPIISLCQVNLNISVPKVGPQNTKWRFSWNRRMPSSGMWRRVDPVKWTDISEERIASILRVEKSASEEPAWAGSSSCHRYENLKSYTSWNRFWWIQLNLSNLWRSSPCINLHRWCLQENDGTRTKGPNPKCRFCLDHVYL
jgi:hypothetical protein